MISAGTIGEGAKLATSRFAIVGVIPSLVLITAVTVLVGSGPPGGAPSLATLQTNLTHINGGDIALLSLAVFVLAAILQPGQYLMVRLLEGYWGSSRLARYLATPGKTFHGWRRLQLEKRRLLPRTPEPSREAIGQAMHATRLLQVRYPAQSRIMPTLLGNALRAAEDRAGQRYGLATVVVWPRLYPLIAGKLARILDDQRTQMDVAVRFCLVFVAIAATFLALLYQYAKWLWIPALALVLAYLAYRSAVTAAVAYGTGIETAFDLYRFDCLAAMHLPLPTDSSMERLSNRGLSYFLTYGTSGDVVDFEYSHSQLPARSAGASELAELPAERTNSKVAPTARDPAAAGGASQAEDTEDASQPAGDAAAVPRG